MRSTAEGELKIFPQNYRRNVITTVMKLLNFIIVQDLYICRLNCDTITYLMNVPVHILHAGQTCADFKINVTLEFFNRLPIIKDSASVITQKTVPYIRSIVMSPFIQGM